MDFPTKKITRLDCSKHGIVRLSLICLLNKFVAFSFPRPTPSFRKSNSKAKSGRKDNSHHSLLAIVKSAYLDEVSRFLFPAAAGAPNSTGAKDKQYDPMDHLHPRPICDHRPLGYAPLVLVSPYSK